ncbi:HAMP domain-containing protein [Deinococcus sp. Arct2-2]|uniref:sensor histidine kinase n=1 Tax=Deinococcus sp. Arct2-2 TaxID=2568653 RepID=UPI0010A3CA60|nr:ATP-binding protein [Deinococcus sp. Arct2-2]THF67719.1 HAMP domain-containing protein [Deinococcus sp. Arct2-2]
MTRLWVRVWSALIGYVLLTFLLLLGAAFVADRPGAGEDAGVAFLFALLAAVAGSLSAALWLAKSVARPLEEVSRAAGRLARGAFEVRIPPPGGLLSRAQETQQVVEDVNQLASALQHLEAERRGAAATIAHELRTPLTVLCGRLEGLRDGVLVADAAELELLLTYARLLERLVDDLRTLSLADAGQLTLSLERTELSQLIKKTVDSLSVRASQAQIHIFTQLQPVEAVLDVARMQQVLGALLDNALKYTPTGGQVEVKLSEAGGEVCIEIQDSGPGMTSEQANQVFERFYRAPGTRRSGQGLGLAVVRAIIQAHGGTVGVEKRPQGGSLFWIRWR